MSKSKYPNQIDTSTEIPTVRDNITEIGSDVLNAYKSAILALERTLGINPQGSVGNTVASRLGRVVDVDGNLLSSAISQAGILSGPITNNEVSNAAGIAENKLDLNYPTQLLQDEISILESEFEIFNENLNNLATQFVVHINTSAFNRHPATAISVTPLVTQVPSNIASVEITSSNVQLALEDIYNGHILFSGANISEENNSHTAGQIFFDNTEISNFVNANNVQEAIEDLADIADVGLINSLVNLNSNGLIRVGKHTDYFDTLQYSDELIESSEVTYVRVTGKSRTTFIFGTTPTPSLAVSLYDSLVLSGSVNDIDNKPYQISNVVLNDDGSVNTIEVFGGPVYSSSSGLTAIVYKNRYQVNNPAGLLAAARPRSNKSNTPDVQVANPNAATIISDVISVNYISEESNTFGIEIDGGSEQLIETFDSNLSAQSIDSIVNKINEQAVDFQLNFLAYKYSAERFALVHNLPNFSDDIKNRTLKISTGSEADGTEYLGLSDLLDTLVEGSGGNTIFLNGKILDSYHNIQKFDNSEIELVASSSSISLVALTFSELGVRIGDLVVIDGAEDSADDGAYRIDTINSAIITLGTEHSFVGNLGTGTIYLIRCSATIGELTFEEINDDDGVILFDIFLDENLDIHYSKRMEVDGELRNGSFIGTDQEATLNITTSGVASLTGPDAIAGPEVYVGLPGNYILFASDRFSYIILRVGTTGLPNVNISATLYGFDEVGRGNYLISRGVFSTYLGRVIGYSSDSGVPVLIDKRNTGTISENNISESVIEKYIEGPRNELRGSGVIRGCRVLNVQLYDGYQTFDVEAGVAVVNGIRVEFPGRLERRINTEENFYVALDSYGNVLADVEIENPDGYTIDSSNRLSPFFDRTVSHLASVENQTIFDLRLFVDHLDYKVCHKILVSNDQDLGHFLNIKSAVEYVKRFSNIWRDAGTPNIYIREGLYEVDSPVIIDFDLRISGSGPSTIIRKTADFAAGNVPVSGSPNPLATVFYLGNTSDNSTLEIIRGITLENFTYELTEDLVNVGACITLAESRGSTGQGNEKIFQFNNIMFIGNGLITYGDGDDENLKGEYAIVVGFANIISFIPVAGNYGNIRVSDCLFNGMGVEKGPCLFRDAVGMEYRNIIVSRNIAKELSPILGDSSYEIFQTVTTANINDMIESCNIVSA